MERMNSMSKMPALILLLLLLHLHDDAVKERREVVVSGSCGIEREQSSMIVSVC
jgi:hypothetical protein